MCLINTDILQEYIDGNLEKHERLLLKEHLKICEKCRSKLTQLKIIDWDLCNMHIEVPQELEMIRKASLEIFFGQKEKLSLGIKGVLGLHRQIFLQSTSFIQYMPKSRFLGKMKSKLAMQTGNLFRKERSRGVFGKLMRI